VHGLQDVFVPTHTKVVIGAPDGDALLWDGHMRTRELFRKPIDVIEVAVGFVLVLLGQLTVVETIIVEARSRWGTGLCTSVSVGLLDEGLRLLRRGSF
jgi:hypothetical protein